MLSHFHLIPERHGQTDGQNCNINIVRQYTDARRASVSILTRDKNVNSGRYRLCGCNVSYAVLS